MGEGPSERVNMLGAIAGDIIGSIYEFEPIKRKDFPLFDEDCFFTDDTVLTIAVADVVLHGGSYTDQFLIYYRQYPDAGYGGYFHKWALSEDPKPYGSYGNGSAMRVSPVGFAFDDLTTVLAEAKRSAEVTHDHPEGIKGAQAVAAAILLARKGIDKAGLRSYLEQTFGYDLSRSVDAIRPEYYFDETCQGTVPAALISVLNSNSFEDAIRNAISLGGDSDTLACIAGSIAEAFYGGIPPSIEHEALRRLSPDLKSVTCEFRAKFVPRR
jgi:ADP-ribosylglycohydrolase